MGPNAECGVLETRPPIQAGLPDWDYGPGRALTAHDHPTGDAPISDNTAKELHV